MKLTHPRTCECFFCLRGVMSREEREREYDETCGGEPSRPHGRSRYITGGRCPICVQANRDYQREYMRLHRQGIRMKDDVIDSLVPR